VEKAKPLMDPENARRIAEKLNYRHNGLLIVVVQDALTSEVLMVALANREAVEKTLTTGLMHYWSTSRQKLWLKGETSGNYQLVEEILVDCDGDALLAKVKQIGVACHLGEKSCFHRNIMAVDEGEIEVED
jgi:phosphoribosyl-AMP cyclohydrolase